MADNDAIVAVIVYWRSVLHMQEHHSALDNVLGVLKLLCADLPLPTISQCLGTFTLHWSFMALTVGYRGGMIAKAGKPSHICEPEPSYISLVHIDNNPKVAAELILLAMYGRSVYQSRQYLSRRG